MSFHARRCFQAAPLLFFFAMPLVGQTTCPDPTRLTAGMDGPLAHVRYLADDALEGRAVGSEGARCAADYIAAWFEDLGLEPAGEDGSYYHTFTIRNGSELGEGNNLTVGGRPLSVGEDWTPLGFSATAQVEAELVFAGTGLSSPGNTEDRFTRVDVTGKVMVVSWGDPDDASGRSLRSSPHFKATVAAGRDAAAVLVLMPAGMELPTLDQETRGALAIPAGVVHGSAAAAVRAAAEDGAMATLQAEVVPTTTAARNVVALLPGVDPGEDEYVVVGAHFDHLGYGGESSLDPDSRAVHNGADDNASGTAALMDIAQTLVRAGPYQRSILFMGFTGEERGLWGSARYLEDPTVSVESMVAMLNLDMVGRLATGNLVIAGVGTADEWTDLIEAANAELQQPLSYGTTPDGYGASDHASFYEAGVPVLHLFTNTHADYHRPSDDWEKIDGQGLERIADLTSEVVARVAGMDGWSPANITAILQARPSPASGQAARSGNSAGLGVIPDMTPRDFGLRITGVREGGAAAGAGLQAGDVIVEFAGKEVTDIYAYMYALQEHEPGDEVTVVVERDGERLTMTAVLQGR